MDILTDITKYIGNTPLLNLNKLTDGRFKLYAKAEYLNPFGSVKDRIAYAMIKDGERRGVLKKGMTVVEPTSGNTGIALSAIGSLYGYKVKIVMPDNMSRERVSLIKAYGGEVIFTDGAKGMSGAVEKAEKLQKEGAYMPSQFTNIINVLTHYRTTGEEIYRQTDGKADIFVAGVGTGGTVTGVGRLLKEKIKGFKVYAAEPARSAVFSGEQSGKHAIQGIGAGFVPPILDEKILDGVLKITDGEALSTKKLLAEKFALFTGISSGANVSAALKLGAREENEGKIIITVLPDSGDRYISLP